MKNYPDLSGQGYEVIRELGRNREGGRITWLASTIDTTDIKQQVVVKQFCFAQSGSEWSAFSVHEREIQVLQGLNHPGIPRYLGGFSTSDGFCMVQEYIDAPSLGVLRSFEPEEIKQIAVSVLEILVYLQNRIPPVIHRDIKPENILVDDLLRVYLIDFGFARIGSQEVSGSSVFKGTPGFIPPEQLRKPTEASDLYGLGATLICLLTGTPSTALQDLTDEDDPYLIRFSHLIPQLSLRFVSWLEKMVQPRLRDRYPNAVTALEDLKSLYVFRVPEVSLNTNSLVFQATRLSEKITQKIQFRNLMPDTLLEGSWEVAPHLQDPPHTPDSHAWISFSPANFKENLVKCEITVDTSLLAADKHYERHLLLHTNASPETHDVTIRVQTAPLPIDVKKPPYKSMAVLFIFSTVITTIVIGILGWSQTAIGIIALAVATVATIWGTGANLGIKAWSWIGGGIGLTFIGLAIQITQGFSSAFFALIFGAISGAMLGAAFGVWVDIIVINLLDRDFWREITLDRFVLTLSALSTVLGIALGMGLVVGFINVYTLLTLGGSGLPLAAMLLYPSLKHRWLIARYRKSEQNLIQP